MKQILLWNILLSDSKCAKNAYQPETNVEEAWPLTKQAFFKNMVLPNIGAANLFAKQKSWELDMRSDRCLGGL